MPKFLRFSLALLLPTALLAGCGGDEAEDGPPRTLVAIEMGESAGQGKVVRLDPDTGAVQKELATEAVGMVSLTPDGKTVYFGRMQEGADCSVHFARVPTDGGPVEDLPDAAGPAAISPDGKELAYINVCGDIDLRIRDLATKEERVVARPTEALSLAIYAPSWSSDGKRLAVTVNQDNGTPSAWIYDADKSVTLENGQRVPPYADGVVYQIPAFLDDGAVAVVSTQRWSATEVGAFGSVVIVDARTGRQRTVVREDEHHYTAVAPDRSRTRFLLAGLSDGLARSEPNGTVKVISHSQIASADWR